MATTLRARANKGCKASEWEDVREREGGRKVLCVRADWEEALSSRMACERVPSSQLEVDRIR